MLLNRRVIKPPFGTPLDLSNPLTKGLRGFYALNENDGATCADATGNLSLATTGFGASNPWGSGTSIGLDCPPAGMGAMATLPAYLQWSGPITIAVGFRRLGNTTRYGNLCALYCTNADASPYRVASIMWGAKAGQIESEWCYNSTLEPSLLSSGIIAAGVDSVVSMTFVPGNPGAQSLYINGRQDSTAAEPQYPTWTSTAQFAIGTYPGYSPAGANSLIYWAGWWGRVLAPSEHAALAINPWQVFEPRAETAYVSIPDLPPDYTLSGPPSGQIGASSDFFIETPTATVASDTLTLSDGEVGGVFLPSSHCRTVPSTPQTFIDTPMAFFEANAVRLPGALEASISGSPALVSSAKVGSLRIPANGNITTGNVSFANAAAAEWSIAFFLRMNAAPPALVYYAFYMLGQAIVISINPGSLYISAGLSDGYISAQPSFAAGQTFHVALSVNAAGTTYLFINGAEAASGRIGASGGGGTGTSPVVFRSYSGSEADFCVGGLGMWGGYALTQADAANLAAGAGPSTVSTPVAYYSFLGTTNAVAQPGDSALANLGSGGSAYDLVPDGTYAGYSSDVLAFNTIVAVGEAFISRTGALAFFRVVSTFSSFYLAGNDAVYSQSVLSVRVDSGGSGYTNPTAAISGGSPTTAAVLGTPVVVGGAIVGVPVWAGGAGYSGAADITIAISDPTGTGASCVPVVGGSPLAVTAVSSQPTISVNGSPVALNPQSFWAATNLNLSWAAFQLATPVTPGQVVTYSAAAGWLGCPLGTLAASGAGGYVANYAGTLEPMFVPPSYSLQMGVNHTGSPMDTYANCLIGQDASKRFTNGGTMASMVLHGGHQQLDHGRQLRHHTHARRPHGRVRRGRRLRGRRHLHDRQRSDHGGLGRNGGHGVHVNSDRGIHGRRRRCGRDGYLHDLERRHRVGDGHGGRRGYCDGIYTCQWDDTAPIRLGALHAIHGQSA